MSRQDLIDPSDRLLMPARRQALFTARDIMLAALATFAMITVSGQRTKRALALEVRDTKGEKRWEWRTTAAELAEGTRR